MSKTDKWLAKFRDVRVSAIIFGAMMLWALSMILDFLRVAPVKQGTLEIIMTAVIAYALGAYSGSMIKLSDDSTPPPPTMTEAGAIEAMKIAAGKTV